jgi:hypothetical protein
MLTTDSQAHDLIATLDWLLVKKCSNSCCWLLLLLVLLLLLLLVFDDRLVGTPVFVAMEVVALLVSQHGRHGSAWHYQRLALWTVLASAAGC